MTNGEIDYHIPNVAWSGHHLIVADEDVVERKLRRPELSPSIASTYNQCPARAVGDRLKPFIEDPFAANEMGSGGHWVMEQLMMLDPDERTRERAQQFLHTKANEVWATEKLVRAGKAELAANADNRTLWVNTISEWIDGQFQLEDPRTVEVEAVEFRLDGVRIGAGVGGVEGIPLKGFVDRTDIIVVDGQRRRAVRDYKFGKADKKKANPDPRYSDDYGDQLRIYVSGYTEKTGEKPAEAKLFFPRGPFERVVDLSESAMRKTLLAFRQGWNRMNESADRRSYEAIPSPLCSWCHLVNSCPVAQLSSKQNAVDSRARMPSALQLGIPRVRVGATLQEVRTAPGVTVPVPPPVPVGEASIEPVGEDLFPVTLQRRAMNGEPPIPLGAEPQAAAAEQAPESAQATPAPDAAAPADPWQSWTDPETPVIPEGVPGIPAVAADQQAALRAAVDAVADGGQVWLDEDGLLVDATPPQTAHVEGTGINAPQHNERKNMNTERSLGVREEVQSYHEVLDNGSLNLASFAFTATTGLVIRSFHTLNGAGIQPTKKALMALSNILAGIVLRTQRDLTGYMNFQRQSQVRIRQLLAAFIEERPLPFGGTTSDWEGWINRAEKFIKAGFECAETLWANEHVAVSNDHLLFASDSPTFEFAPQAHVEPAPVG